MVGRNRGDVICQLHLIDIVLNLNIFPGFLIIGLELRIILHILPALEREGRSHGVSFIIDQLFLILLIRDMEISVICPRIAQIKIHYSVRILCSNLKYSFFLIAPYPVRAGPGAGNIFHTRIKGQGCRFIASIDPLDLLCVSCNLFRSQETVKTERVLIAKTSCRIIQYLQTDKRFLHFNQR